MKPETENFELHDIVAWDTHGGKGAGERRVGRIVHVIPKDQTPNARLIIQAHAASKKFKVGFARRHESYIVRVDAVGPGAKNKVFWPLVSQLRKVHPSAEVS